MKRTQQGFERSRAYGQDDNGWSYCMGAIVLTNCGKWIDSWRLCVDFFCKFMSFVRVKAKAGSYFMLTYSTHASDLVSVYTVHCEGRL